MSYNFVLGVEDSKQRYQERLQEAEHARRVKKLMANQPGFQQRLLLNLGSSLVSLGRRLTGQNAKQPSHSGSTASVTR